MAAHGKIYWSSRKMPLITKKFIIRDKLCENSDLEPFETVYDVPGVKELIKKRDFEDSSREISPLIKANDAIEVITDGYTINEVVDKIIDLYDDKIPKETEIK